MQSHALPLLLSVESSNPQMVPGKAGSTSLRIGLIAGGIGVALVVIARVKSAGATTAG